MKMYVLDMGWQGGVCVMAKDMETAVKLFNDLNNKAEYSYEKIYAEITPEKISEYSENEVCHLYGDS